MKKPMKKPDLKRSSLCLALALLLCASLAVPSFAEASTVVPTITIELPDSNGLQLTLTNFVDQCWKHPSMANYSFYYTSETDCAISFNKDLYAIPVYKEGEEGVQGTSYQIGFYDPDDERDAKKYAVAGETLYGSAIDNREFPSILYVYPDGTRESRIEIRFESTTLNYAGSYSDRDDKSPVAQFAVSATPSAPAGSASPTAKPTASTVIVGGESVAFDAYNINDNNYFKLRDLAFTLSGTEKQFEVGWDSANNAIALTSGKAYTSVGGEMEGKGADDKTAAPTSSKIILDSKEVSLTAYNIGGNNYFKLRDIGAAFDFGVDWDGAKNTIVIDTSKSYTPE
ncbi:MAG: hypothetical protein LBS24_06885 [Clostridiales Family XIII bacterium]|jgi:hypothetical protein|nr:hypothetical protein [Clostridiales Family XIII bacterium]